MGRSDDDDGMTMPLHHVQIAAPAGSEDPVDVDAVAALVLAAGGEVAWADPAEWAGSPHEGLRRFHTHDPVGNRLEMVERRPVGGRS